MEFPSQTYDNLEDEYMDQIFISYSRKDKKFVQHLSEKLVDLDKKAWVDWRDIPPTIEWFETILSAIEKTNAFVFVISPHSIASETCKKELAHALKCNKRLIPILYSEVDLDTVPDSVSV